MWNHGILKASSHFERIAKGLDNIFHHPPGNVQNSCYVTCVSIGAGAAQNCCDPNVTLVRSKHMRLKCNRCVTRGPKASAPYRLNLDPNASGPSFGPNRCVHKINRVKSGVAVARPAAGPGSNFLATARSGPRAGGDDALAHHRVTRNSFRRRGTARTSKRTSVPMRRACTYLTASAKLCTKTARSGTSAWTMGTRNVLSTTMLRHSATHTCRVVSS